MNIKTYRELHEQEESYAFITLGKKCIIMNLLH